MSLLIDAIFSGVISKVINDVADTSKPMIKKAVKYNNARSSETQVYQVIIETLKSLKDSNCDEDAIFDAAENILEGFQNIKLDNEIVVKRCLKNICSNVDDDKFQEFKLQLYHEISKDSNAILYKEILLAILSQEAEYNHEELKYIRNELAKIDRSIQELNTKENCKESADIIQNNKFRNNKKQIYADNWNRRLFLHQDNDENPLTLSDAYIMPDYCINKSIERLRFNNEETLDTIIEKFVAYDRTSSMLITGEPGIGKTSITSWIANKYKGDDRFIILRFRDWEDEELENRLLKAICGILGCRKTDLEGKIIVLDGFDEMKALDRRYNILGSFLDDIKDFDNFKCIITSRPAYIEAYDFENALELKEFDIVRVENFYMKIKGKKLDKKEKIESNLEVLGIPVILYMAIMSDVDISENPTKPELYNSIFAEKGGIFDKFHHEGGGYGGGSHILRKSENTKKYLRFLQEIALKMFEADSLSVQIEENKIPTLLDYNERPVKILEFPIKHLFENTTSYTEFIHKSIYEYFVSECIFSEISEAINISKEVLACTLGKLFGKNVLSAEQLEFLKYRIQNSCINDKFNFVNETFELMLRNGMTYYVKESYENVIKNETNIFANMLEFIHLWENSDLTYDHPFFNYLEQIKKTHLNLSNIKFRTAIVEKDHVLIQNLELQEAYLSGANLINIYLGSADLSGTNFQTANLSNANLGYTNLSRTNFSRANLSGADLENASLIEANLSKANCERANLHSAHLSEVNLTGANLKNANLSRAILSETDLTGANLEGTNFKKADLVNSNLSELNLSKADFSSANLQSANLSKVNSPEASFVGANLDYANLSEANLTKTLFAGASLIRADLFQANFEGANLQHVFLRGTYLREVNLKDAFMMEAELMHADLSDANLTGACLLWANLTNAHFERVSLSGANFIKAILTDIHFEESNLEGAIFHEDQVEYLEEKYSLQGTIIHIEKAKSKISYEEYCNIRSKT